MSSNRVDVVNWCSEKILAQHYHCEVDDDETVCGLARILAITPHCEPYQLHSGDVVYLPRGVVYVHENRNDETACALIVLNPGSIGQRFSVVPALIVNVPSKPDIG